MIPALLTRTSSGPDQFLGEGADRRELSEIERPHVGVPVDDGGDARALGGVADREHDPRAGSGEGAGGLGAQST